MKHHQETPSHYLEGRSSTTENPLPGKSYSEELIKEPGLEKRNPAPTPRTSSMKFTIENEELLDAEQHSTNASWQTTMAVLHQTKHELLHQRTCKITTATINEGHKATLVFYQVPCWYHNIQVQN